MTYYWDYPNSKSMSYVDALSPFEKWWRNFSTQRLAPYIPKTHFVTIEEGKRYTSRGKEILFFIATIGADHTEEIQTVTFKPGTPRPPAYFYPATEKYVPPKVLSEKERVAQRLRWAAQDALGAMWRKGNPTPAEQLPAPKKTFIFN